MPVSFQGRVCCLLTGQVCDDKLDYSNHIAGRRVSNLQVWSHLTNMPGERDFCGISCLQGFLQPGATALPPHSQAD